MHEYSIVQSLLEEATREAWRAGAVAVHRLTVRLGEVAGVDAELLRKAYEVCRVGTPCAAAELEIVPEPARWACPRCDASIAPGAPLRCPVCAVPASLRAGDALILERLELELPDPAPA